MTRFGKKWISIAVELQIGKQFLCGNGMMLLCKKQLGNRTLFAMMEKMETVSLGGHHVADTCCPIKPFLSIKPNHKWANQFGIFFESGKRVIKLHSQRKLRQKIRKERKKKKEKDIVIP